MLKVMEYSGKIQKAEGGDPAIITLAACLSALAGVTSGAEAEGAEFSVEDEISARSILSRAGAPDEVTRRVLSILRNPTGRNGGDDSANFKCVSDAVRIAEAVEARKGGRTAGVQSGGEAKSLLTETGRKLMEQVLSKSSSQFGAK